MNAARALRRVIAHRRVGRQNLLEAEAPRLGATNAAPSANAGVSRQRSQIAEDCAKMLGWKLRINAAFNMIEVVSS